jgi:hypothetical protein
MLKALRLRAKWIRTYINITDIRAAIIIQEMVDADVAGACNTDETTVGLFDNDIETFINNKDTLFFLMIRHPMVLKKLLLKPVSKTSHV